LILLPVICSFSFVGKIIAQVVQKE